MFLPLQAWTRARAGCPRSATLQQLMQLVLELLSLAVAQILRRRHEYLKRPTPTVSLSLLLASSALTFCSCDCSSWRPPDRHPQPRTVPPPPLHQTAPQASPRRLKPPPRLAREGGRRPQSCRPCTNRFRRFRPSGGWSEPLTNTRRAWSGRRKRPGGGAGAGAVVRRLERYLASGLG